MTLPNHFKRHNKTIVFLKKNIPPPAKILDLGIKNSLSELMFKEGYDVINTKGEDLDNEYEHINEYDVDLITAFEIFEHMLAPYNLLKSLNNKKLLITVPLNVWFSSAYWNEKDDRDKHYHEFEQKQLDFLLEKTGWTIKNKELWTMPPGNINGFRPLLRYIWPSYYAVFCVK